ncbi:MAG TPA: hypothetical protein VK002_06645 [Rubricoccaceae bacterium]|jgi:hypothetical protein|nr:hypothetical protein [Rubricoccaceae bacterium]
MPASTYVLAVTVSASPLTVYHRGFALAVLQRLGRSGARGFGFEVRHRGLLLHASPGAYGTATEAEGAARRLIDDALGALGPAR